MDGTLSLFELTKLVSPARNAGSTSATKKQGVSYEDVDPHQMQSPAGLIINQQASARADTNVQNNPAINEQAQAAVLIAAAEQGTPLCERCLEQAV